MSTAIDPEEVRRELEAKLLLDTVRVTLLPTGAPVLGPETGLLGDGPVDVVYEGPGALLSGHGHGQVAAWGIVGRQWLDDTVSWYRLPTPLTAPVPARYDRVEVVLAHPRDAATGRQVWQVLRPLAQQVPVSLLPAYAGMDPTPATPAPPSKAAPRARGVGQALAGARQAFFCWGSPGGAQALAGAGQAFPEEACPTPHQARPTV